MGFETAFLDKSILMYHMYNRFAGLIVSKSWMEVSYSGSEIKPLLLSSGKFLSHINFTFVNSSVQLVN